VNEETTHELMEVTMEKMYLLLLLMSTIIAASTFGDRLVK
jgi:hypothetical protein